ncbi:MAG TPA: amidohydrolase family protein, partial [Terriglobia bacterium]|nr:amidohydrolase family protein [Terriglobia bacterium]
MIPAIVLIFLLSSVACSEDLVLVNGSVIDGSGKLRTAGNVRIHDGKITDIGVFKPLPNETVLDIKGLIVSPGFVDFRSLAPSDIKKDPAAPSLVMQGVTTAILGADGTGVYSVEQFMLPFDDKAPGVNIAMLVGHATIRRQIMGDDYKRAATADEVQRMSELITDAMQQGAFGLASDLQHEPASFSTTDELLVLAKATAKFGGAVLLHARDPKESASIAKDAKVNVVDFDADGYSFSRLAQEKGVTLERAIPRMTSAPASRFGLRERGTLKKGVPADLVIFNPVSLSSGMKYVFVNGMMAVKDGQLTGA